jgi:Holliday junction DNA helicase RuvB
VASEALDLLEIDHRGLDQMDRRILQTIAEKFGGGPVGIRTLAIALGEDEGTLDDVYEPFLIQEGFINRTPSGRMLTRDGYQHLNLEPPANLGGQPALF